MPFRLVSFRVLLLAATLGVHALQAQEQAPPQDEVRLQLTALREAVIQQTRQIDLLTAEVARMNRVLGTRRTPSEPVVSLPASPAPAAAPGAAPVQSLSPETAPQPVTAAPTPPPATGPEHVVVKGDRLAVIAKKYGTTVDDLQKLNQITDPRKIQVGQILKLPPNTATPTPTPTPTP